MGQSGTSGNSKNLRVFDGDTGTQIIRNGSAGAATVTLYTVTAAKTFYLCDIFGGQQPTGGVQCDIVITNGADVVQSTLYSWTNLAGTNVVFTKSYAHPISIPAGWKVKLITAAATTLNATISGWEE